jgi:hypothetical protein
MLIPIGFFGGGAAAGAYELISTAYGTGSSGTISFTSIPSTYKHLQIRGVGRQNTNGEQTDIGVRFNGSSASSYARHRLYGNGSAVSSQATTSTESMILSEAIADYSATANVGWPVIIDVLDYANSTKNKTIRAMHGGSDNVSAIINFSSGFFNGTSAVSSIQLFLSGGNYTTTSRFSLYGIKG